MHCGLGIVSITHAFTVTPIKSISHLVRHPNPRNRNIFASPEIHPQHLHLLPRKAASSSSAVFPSFESTSQELATMGLGAGTWVKMLGSGALLCIGGPYLVYYVTPSEEELFQVRDFFCVRFLAPPCCIISLSFFAFWCRFCFMMGTSYLQDCLSTSWFGIAG